MTSLGTNAEAAARLPSSMKAGLSIQAADLLEILRAASASAPVTQLKAGQMICLSGSNETIRRTVQRLRDEITARTGKLICSSWAQPAGMWLPTSEQEEDDYIGRVLGRAYKTIGQFRGLEREKRLRIAEEVQGLLDIGDGKIGPQRTPLPVAGKRCPQCGDDYRMWRSDQVYCSPECRYDAARARGSI